MQNSQQPSKKALRDAVKAAKAALAAAERPPKYPSRTKQCRYCGVAFKTPQTYNGSMMEFCIPNHRKAYQKEGRKPIAAILKKQERHMRQICREEIAAAITRMQIDPTYLRFTRLAENPSTSVAGSAQ